MALVLALASVKGLGDLQTLSVGISCLEFGPNDYKIILKPRQGYVPKVLSTSFRAQVITLLVLPIAEGEQGSNQPVRAFRVYLERSSLFRQSEDLFICFKGCHKGLPVTKQQLSRWTVDAIGVRAHSTRGMASFPLGKAVYICASLLLAWGTVCSYS